MSVSSSDSNQFSKKSKHDDDSQMDALMQACIKGNESEVRNLLQGPQGRKRINEKAFSSGNAPIHVACRAGHLHIVRLLILRGANPEECSRCGATPLQMAIVGDHLRIVQFLCRDYNRETDDSTSARDERWKETLHYAVLFARPTILSWLLENGADPNQIFPCGRTAVHLICSTPPADNNDLGVVCLDTLIDCGADLTLYDTQGRMAIHVANSVPIVSRIMRELGNDIINQTDLQGWTPLHHACASVCNREEIGEYLLRMGADVSARNNDGDVPLHLALRHHGGPLTQLLLQHPATNVMAKDGLGRNPLHLVLIYQRTEKYILQFLRDSFLPLGGDINNATDSGWTPFHYTVFYNLFHVQEFLLKKGASISKPNAAGQTPAHMIGTKNFRLDGGEEEFAFQAALDGKIPARLKSGLRDPFPRPLDYEMCYRVQKADVPWPAQHDGVLACLLRRGVDCTKPDNEGNLPFFLAASTDWFDASYGMLRMAASQGLFDGLEKTSNTHLPKNRNVTQK